MKPPSTPAAILAIEEAMVLVERAQRDLERACQRLSPVVNGADLWKKVGKATNAVHACWSHLDVAAKSRPGMHTDREPAPCSKTRGG